MLNKKIKFIVLIYILFIFNCLAQNSTLETNLLNLIEPFRGTVGISVKNLHTQKEINLNANEKYPMQSVYKLHLAMAVFGQIDKGKLKLNQKMNLRKSDLLPNTHSPLREKYPNGKADITLKEILQATVSQSDNNGCDYLFKLMGSCKNVDKFIKKYQKDGINIAFTEEEMHADSARQYINFAKPNATTALLEKFYTGKILSKKSTKALWEMLVETTTAPKRIKGNLPTGTIFGHKSGWSGGDDRGFTNAINDTGIMILPDGTPIAITIFIKNTYEKSDKSDELSSKIGRLVFEYFLK